MRWRVVLIAAASSATGCGELATTDLLKPPSSTGDAGPPFDAAAADTGFVRRDAGLDAGARDGGRRDTGAFDGGRPDSGLIPSGDEGRPCTPGSTTEGTCRYPANACITWSQPMDPMIVSSCVRECQGDFDCMDSQIGPLCRSVQLGARACVAEERELGEVIDPSLSRGGPMTGCNERWEAVPWWIGSMTFDLEQDQLSCGARCLSDHECPSRAPHCALDLLPDAPSGLCQRRIANRGARCSQRSAIELCEIPIGARVVCVDAGLSMDENLDPNLQYGICLEICTRDDQTCRTEGDPNHAPVCEFGLFNSPDIGVCDDNCHAFPDDCTGIGSPPPAGGTARGAMCLQINGTLDAPEFSLCVDIAQDGALFDVWDFVPPPTPCAQSALRCPDRSICEPVDPATSACVIGCDPQGMPTGCEGRAQPTCNESFGSNVRAGVCQ